jgi:hypothetical protein
MPETAVKGAERQSQPTQSSTPDIKKRENFSTSMKE